MLREVFHSQHPDRTSVMAATIPAMSPISQAEKTFDGNQNENDTE
jgi:hypothetical protein